MRVRKVWLLLAGGALLAVALGAAVLVARDAPAAGTPAGAGPLAVVLVPRLEGSELVSVDTDTGRVVGRVRLRSLATDIEADPARGLVIAAQTGGVGGAADDALSLTDPRSGSVRYVKLPRIDPSQIEIVGWRAVVLHAVVDRVGFVVSVVDLRSGSVVATGHAPEGTGLWAAAGGSVWTAVATGGATQFALVQVDPATLATEAGPAVGFTPTGVTMSGGRVLVLGAEVADPTSALVAALGSGMASVEESAAVPGLAHGAHVAVTVGDTVVVGDWNGEVPETCSLAVLDRTTLAPLRTLDVGGAPCAIAAHGRWLLVVDRVSGSLLQIDPRTGKTGWRTALGESDLVCSQVVVVPGR